MKTGEDGDGRGWGRKGGYDQHVLNSQRTNTNIIKKECLTIKTEYLMYEVNACCCYVEI